MIAPAQARPSTVISAFTGRRSIWRRMMRTGCDSQPAGSARSASERVNRAGAGGRIASATGASAAA